MNPSLLVRCGRGAAVRPRRALAGVGVVAVAAFASCGGSDDSSGRSLGDSRYGEPIHERSVAVCDRFATYVDGGMPFAEREETVRELVRMVDADPSVQAGILAAV